MIRQERDNTAGQLTKIFDIDGALLPETGAVNGYRFCIGNQVAVATFGDSETMNGCAGSASDFLIEIRGGAIRSHGHFFRKFFRRFAWWYILLGGICGCLGIAAYLLGGRTESGGWKPLWAVADGFRRRCPQ